MEGGCDGWRAVAGGRALRPLDLAQRRGQASSAEPSLVQQSRVMDLTSTARSRGTRWAAGPAGRGVIGAVKQCPKEPLKRTEPTGEREAGTEEGRDDSPTPSSAAVLLQR